MSKRCAVAIPLCLMLACEAPQADEPVELASNQGQSLVLEVPAQHATIHAAIRAAQDGDEIVVAAGVYENSLVIDKDLTIRGAGIGRTIVRRGISLRESGRVTLTDLTIEGQGGGIGIYVDRRLPSLARLEVTGFQTGILVRRVFGDFRLDASKIVGNVVGIDMSQVLGGRIANSLILSNTRGGSWRAAGSRSSRSSTTPWSATGSLAPSRSTRPSPSVPSARSECSITSSSATAPVSRARAAAPRSAPTTSGATSPTTPATRPPRRPTSPLTRASSPGRLPIGRRRHGRCAHRLAGRERRGPRRRLRARARHGLCG